MNLAYFIIDEIYNSKTGKQSDLVKGVIIKFNKYILYLSNKYKGITEDIKQSKHLWIIRKIKDKNEYKPNYLTETACISLINQLIPMFINRMHRTNKTKTYTYYIYSLTTNGKKLHKKIPEVELVYNFIQNN